MTGLLPFNRKSIYFPRASMGFDDFYNMLDDFFSDSVMPRSFIRDSFRIDIEDKEAEYLIEADLPGVRKEEIDLHADGETLCITVNRSEEDTKGDRNYMHRERHTSTTCRRIRLSGANMDDIQAKLENGVLSVLVPKTVKESGARKIEIQ